VPYGGPEYWSVIYRAVADFGDVIAEAAKAKAALDALSKTARDEGAVEARASADAAVAHRTDTAAINEERRALEQLAAASKLAQVWTAWGGRSSPEQHMADMQRQLELETLLNRQEWLGFTSPQQAYAWRQNELNQRRLMNYAEWAGYQTADQFLSYLQKQRTSLADLNSVLLRRSDIYRSNADAALGYANALSGTHKNIGQLGEGLDLSGISQFQSALVGLPDVVSTRLELDDTAALAALAQYESLLRGIPHAETTVLTSSQVRGAVPVTGQPAPEVIPVSFGGPYQEQFARIMAEVARLNALRAEIPVHFDLPPASEITSFISHIPVAGVTEPVHLVSQGGGAGGGGGPPPVAPGAAAEPPDDAAGKWAALAAAENGEAAASADAGDAAVATGRKLDSAGASVQRFYGWWGLLRRDVTLFGGLFGSTALIGSVALWHIALDGIIEALAVLIPAVVTATAGLLGWGAAAARTGQQVYNQMKNVLTVSNALNTTVPPLTGNFQKLQDAVRPQALQLFGDALDLLNGRTGIFQTLVMQTGRVLDEFGARIVVDMQRGGKGLQTFLDTGTKALGMLGQILANIGHAFASLIRATEITHIAEDLLAVVTVLSKLFDLITKIPAPLLAAVLALHGLALWGGLAVTWASRLALSFTSLLGTAGPLSGVMGALAGKLGASDDQLAKIATHGSAVKSVADALGQSAGNIAQFAVAADKGGKSVQELALSTAGGAAMFAKYGSGLEKAGQDSVALAIAAGGTEAQIAKVAASSANAAGGAGFLASVLSRAGGAAGLATGALVALAAAAAVFVVLSLRARDSSQQWIDSINKGLASQSLFTVIGKNISDLAAVTDRLGHSQGLSAQAVHELGGAQAELSGNLALALPRVGEVSRAYGVGMVGALELLNLAGVKTSDLFTRQGIVWATDEQMVKGLVDGYKAMGQQLGTVGSDLNVLLVSESDQLKSMGSLNKAWDSFQKLVSAPVDAILAMASGLRTFAADAKVAGASMLGLSPPAVKLQQDFQSTYGNVETLFDAFRNAQALTGGQGSFTQFVKDAVASLIPLAGTNKAAAAEISQLAQEAGGPATTSLLSLARWAGNVRDPMLALYNASQQATVASSNLSADAAQLATTLQQELNPAMARAAFDAEGGQKALSAFADDLLRMGPGSQVTIAAGKQVADMFLSVDKNSGQAKAQFVGWVESMGYSRKQAEALWGEVSKGARPLADMRTGLASSATASDKLSQSGFFAQTGDKFRSNVREMGTWFGTTLPHFLTSTIPHAAEVAGSAVAGFFTGTAGPPVVSFFTKTIPQAAGAVAGFFSGPFRSAVEGAWSHVWSALVSPVVHVFDDVRHAITSGFDAWWRSHGDEINQVWASVTGTLSREWDNFTGGLTRAWDAVTGALKRAWGDFTGWFRGAGDVSKPVSSAWNAMVTSLKPVLAIIEGLFKVTWGIIVTGAKIAWDLIAATGKTAWDLLMSVLKTAWDAAMAVLKIAWIVLVAALKIAWDIFVGVINVAIDLITGHWGKAWQDMKNAAEQVWNALKAAFTAMWDALFTFLKQAWNNFDAFFRQLWNNALTFLRQAWNAFWSWFDRTIIGNFSNFFTRTIPHWFSEFVGGARSAWSSAWNWFDRTVIGGMSAFFTRTIPQWWRNFEAGASGAMRGVAGSITSGFRNAINWVIDHVINSVINFVDNDILKHLPGGLHIATVGHVASGGDVTRAAGGGPFLRMAAGSVPGTGDEDGTRLVAMGGEYMVRKPARMALESVFGRGFMNYLNQADTWLAAGSRGSPASRQRRPGINYATGGLVNPIGGGLKPERVDMGVDYGGSGSLYALGSGTITNLWNSGWPGGTFLGLRLNPSYGSGYWYYAEDVIPLVGSGIRVGRGVSAGQHIADATGGPSGIEVGWAAPPGTGQTAAAAAGQARAGQAHGDPGAYPTAWGVAASNLIGSLGGPRGIISGPVQGGTGGIGGAISAVWQTVEGLLDAAGSGLGSLVKPLARWVSGGAGELLKLARKGAAAIFSSVWDHAVAPVADLIPGDTIPGAMARYSSAEIKQGIDNFLTGQDKNAQSQAIQLGNLGPGFGVGPVSGPADAGPGQAENYARGRLSAFGWGQDQFPYLRRLWTQESGWNRFARNPSSGAYGIPQALPPTKLPSAGQAGGGSHASPQIDWGMGYIKSAYRTPFNAEAHELAHSWYPSGGVVGGDGASLMASGGTPAWAGPLTGAVRTEMSAFWDLMGAHLPRTGPTMTQRHAFTAWQEALQRQQAKTVGLGTRPPGAFGVLDANFSRPSSIIPAQWSTFTGDLSYLVKEEEGPGAGGINPPGTPANSGYPAWRWLRPRWQNLLTATRRAQSQAGTARAAWTSQSGYGLPATTGTSTPAATDSPEWDTASAGMNTAVRAEMDALQALMHVRLPVKGPSMQQRYAFTSWQEALWRQQLKTVGLGRRPPGAYQAISDRLSAPATLTAREWNTFEADLRYLAREEEGPGAGGINPPGSRPNSGFPAWKWLHPRWKELLSATRTAERKTAAAEAVWSRMYGPHHLPFTPGPGKPPHAAPVGGTVNIMPEATLGGPASPVMPGPGTPDMGFAAGGGLDQVASMFSGGLDTGGTMLPLVVRYGVPDTLLRQLQGTAPARGEYPRRLSEAAASHYGPALNVEQMNINNPLPQKPSDSIAHAANRMSFLAGRGMN
jgi:hypothetical protein